LEWLLVIRDIPRIVEETDSRAVSVQGSPKMLLVEEVVEASIVQHEIGQVLLRPRAYLRHDKTCGTGLDSITNTCQNVVANVTDAARVVVTYKDQTWRDLCLFADSLQWPANVGRVYTGEINFTMGEWTSGNVSIALVKNAKTR
jgi:hypothetical protein